jgi:triosephosphate isomerase
MRKRIVAGNWKMNTDLHEGYKLMKDIVTGVVENDLSDCEIMIFPSFVHLKTFENTINGSGIVLGAQNCHYELSGAYTGEVSLEMLKSIPVGAVLIGHSERRQYFNETDDTVNLKTRAAIAHEIRAIVCCGETLEEREAGKHFDVIGRQIRKALDQVRLEDLERVVLAYEPVWAIGTGVTASDDQAQEVHAFIRNLVSELFDANAASNLQILYGGSVKPSNASALFAKPDIDGGLIGGASLKKDDFLGIIRA